MTFRSPDDPAFARGLHLSVLVLCLGAWFVAILGVLSINGSVGGLLDSASQALSACPFRALTDQRCVLCGTITALSLLLQGNLIESLAVNPLALGLLPMGVSQPAYRIIRVLSPRFVVVEELAVTGAGLSVAITAVLLT